jgi:AcrR family transcriptional regulator
VVDAAAAVVDRDGIDGLTMRRVAEELDSSPMALYRHVRDKDELLVALLDRLVERLPRPDLPEDPRDRILVAFGSSTTGWPRVRGWWGCWPPEI